MTTMGAEMEWQLLADKALRGECLTLEEGHAVLEANDDELLLLMHAAFKVRKHFYSKKSSSI